MAESFRPWAARFGSSSFRARLARGMSWTVAGGLAAKVLGVMSSVVVARLLGQEVFGQLGIVQNTVSMLGVLAGSGLSSTATKHIAGLRGRDLHRAGRVVAMTDVVAGATAMLLSVLLFFGADWVATEYLSAPDLGRTLRISSLPLLFTTLTAVKVGALAGFESFRAIAVRSVSVAALSIPLAIAGARLFGLDGVIWGWAISSIAEYSVCAAALRIELARRGVPYSLWGAQRELPVLWHYSLPAVLSGLLVAPVNWICAAMMTRLPYGYQELGLFNAANHYRSTLLFLPGIWGQVLLSLLSEGYAGGESREMSARLRSVSKLNAALCGIVALGLVIASPWLMTAFGAGFGDGRVVLMVLVGAAYLQMVQAPAVKYLEATGRMWTNFALNALWAVSVIVSSRMLIERGALGLSLSQLIGFIIFGVVVVWYYRFRRPAV